MERQEQDCADRVADDLGDLDTFTKLIVLAQNAEQALRPKDKKKCKTTLTPTETEVCKELTDFLAQKFNFGNGMLFADNPSNLMFWAPLLQKYPVTDQELQGLPYAPFSKPYRDLLEVACKQQVEFATRSAVFCHDIWSMTLKFLQMHFIVH